MTAGNRTALYPNGVGAEGDGWASNRTCTAILRELCVRSHGAGVVQRSVQQLADDLHLSSRTIIYGLQRLTCDGWIHRAVRGTGNRHQPGDSRESVYVLNPLPDSNGEMWPASDWLGEQWVVYVDTLRFKALSHNAQMAVKAAVDNRSAGGLLSDSHDATKCKHCHHSNKPIRKTRTGDSRPRSRRNRANLAVVTPLTIAVLSTEKRKAQRQKKPKPTDQLPLFDSDAQEETTA